MGVKNDIFWSEIGPGGTTQPRIPRSNPPHPPSPLPREWPTYSSSSAILTFTSHLEENAGIDPDYSYLILKIFLQ